MSALSETDHTRLRAAERTWLLHSADRLRRAASERRTAPARPVDPHPDSRKQTS